MASLNDLTPQFARLEPWTQVTFVARLKQEQTNLRRSITRIEVIRETNFVGIGYLLVETVTLVLCLGLILIDMRPRPLQEALFSAGVITFLLVFLLFLIQDLDNPFGYYERFSSADVSLDPLLATGRRLKAMADEATTSEAK